MSKPIQMSNPPTERLSVSNTIRDFQSCHQRLSTYVEKLQQLMSKLEGPRPTGPANPVLEKTPEGLLDQLDHNRRTYSNLLDEFERLLAILENSL